MKKTTTLLFTIFIAITTSNAQTYQWAKSMGGTDWDYGASIAVDGSGNVYTTGYFKLTVDFDPGVGTSSLTSAGGSDIFISKLDAAGNFLWAKRIGGIYDDETYSIAVDSFGSVHTTGYFRGTADFNPGAGTSNLTSAGAKDIFILKLDAAGNFIWAKSIGAINNEYSYSIAVDGSGNVYTNGYFEGTVDFDPGADTSNLASLGSDDFILKLNAAGNFLWAKRMAGNGSGRSESIAVDGSGNVYTTGWFWGTKDFDPGAGTSYLTSAAVSLDIFISKLDTAGNFLWAKRMGGTDEDMGFSIVVDGSGSVYTTGYFWGTADFDPGAGTSNLTSAGFNDIFISKLGPSGNFIWAKRMGGFIQDWGHSIAMDGSGNVYTTGFFAGTADFDPGAGTSNLTSAGWVDIFISKLDATGNFGWAKSIGGIYDDIAYSIAVDSSGNVYTNGYFSGTVDFDPGAGTSNLISVGGADIFVHKMGQCSNTTGTDVQTACDSYTWIDGNTYTASNNTATHNIVGGAANGCDSLVTLYLTINSISDLTTSISGVTISANNTGASYQWLDCANNYSAIVGETGQSFTATANGNYAVELTENGCLDTSACVAITTVGILENNFGNTLKVYPNPTNGELSIDLGTSYDYVTVVIRDLLGQEVFRKSYTDSDVLQLNIPGVAGMYLIEVNSGNKKAIVKVVKE